MNRRLRAVAFFGALFGLVPAAGAVAPQTQDLMILTDPRPGRWLMLPHAPLPSSATKNLFAADPNQEQEAGDASTEQNMTFLGVQHLEKPRFRTESVDGDTAAVIHYFRQVTKAPDLELLPLSHTQDGNSPYELYGFVQSVKGVPILGTFALGEVQQESILYARHYLIDPPHLNVTPGIDKVTAAGLANEDILSFARSAVQVGEPTLAIVHSGNAPILVYQVKIDSEAPWSFWTVSIDANSGKVVAREQSSVNSVGGVVTAKVEPSCQGDAPQSVPMPYVQWTRGLATSGDGTFFSERNLSAAQVSLNGAFFRIQSYAGDNAQAVLPLSSGAGNNTLTFTQAPLSQTDPYYYASQARAWVRDHARDVPALSRSRIWNWTATQLPIKVNLPSGHLNFSCNAFYDGRALNFYQGDARHGCNNSGRAAKIVYHEYGHGIHDHLTANSYTFDHQVSEGVADYVMASITGSPDVTGLMGCNSVLRGINTMRTCVNSYTYCLNKRRCNSFPGDEPHNSAPIMCGALWELRNSFKQQYGEEAGKRRADAFFLKFLTRVTDMNSAYSAAIDADEDNDHDRSNGTVHSCAINAAFLGTGGFAHFPDLRGQRVPCVPTLRANL
jgi:hypothetical protein